MNLHVYFFFSLVPDHPRAHGNKAYYEDAIKNAYEMKRGDDGDVQLDGDSTYSESNYSGKDLSERDQYELLCRSEYTSVSVYFQE